MTDQPINLDHERSKRTPAFVYKPPTVSEAARALVEHLDEIRPSALQFVGVNLGTVTILRAALMREQG